MISSVAIDIINTGYSKQFTNSRDMIPACNQIGWVLASAVNEIEFIGWDSQDQKPWGMAQVAYCYLNKLIIVSLKPDGVPFTTPQA